MVDQTSQNPWVIIAGYGPVGRVASDCVEAKGATVCVIDLNEQTIESLRKQGRAAVLGDANDAAILHKAGIERAQALIIAIPDEEQAMAVSRNARKLSDTVFIVARTNFLSKGMQTMQAGADHVVIEEVVTAEAMGHAVTERFEASIELQ